MSNRVGLLGGTFNPIHRGHVELGLQIREAFQLQKILYIISAQPPHKKQLKIAPTTIRWKMLNTVLKAFPDLEACDIEMKRPTWSWTIDTVKELRKQHPNTDYYFISGSEGFLKIQTWKNYRELLDLLSFIVVLRKPIHKETITTLLEEEKRPPAIEVSSPLQFELSSQPQTYIYSYQSNNLGLSSTLIREYIKTDKPIDNFVENEVKKIMEEYKLYES